MLKELPVEVAEAVLEELQCVQALLGEAERMARAWAEQLRARGRSEEDAPGR